MDSRFFQEVVINGEHLQIFASKVVFHHESQSLIISDLHIGKAAHFRANAIPIPTIANKENFWRLVEAIEKVNPRKLIFLGDLSHSKWNTEWDDFKDFLKQYDTVEKLLIKGNHDILHSKEYEEAGINVMPFWRTGKVLWTHEPIDSEEFYVISGHLHPAVRLVGSAKQSLRLPCFCFGERQGYIPAFGQFTGTALYQPKEGDQIWVIANDSLVKIPT